MAHGYWGSRFPIGNLLSSRLLFAVVRLRIVLRRLANAWNRRLRPRPVPLPNCEAGAESLKKWLDAGYDKLNIGGGRKNLDGFINVDFATFPGVERHVAADITDLSFIPSGCASHVHTNHVVEHVTDDQLQTLFAEFARILKPDGLMTLRCPNALGAAFGFWFQPILEDGKETFLALGFPEQEDLANAADGWMHKDLFGLLHWLHGDMGNVENQHLNVITPSKIAALLEKNGFSIVKATRPEAVNIVVVARKASR